MVVSLHNRNSEVLPHHAPAQYRPYTAADIAHYLHNQPFGINSWQRDQGGRAVAAVAWQNASISS